MTQPLFFEPVRDFPKIAAETVLPEDPNQWSNEVLQELYKQVPYLADFDLDVVMETVEGERGYGLGHVEVSNKTEAPMTAPATELQAAGVRSSRIPIIIRDSKLQPLDVLVTDDARALPLTEGRLRQAMFRPHNFDVTSKTPGDQSMVGQLYPPYRQNHGFGGGGMGLGGGTDGKVASALEAYIASLVPRSAEKIAEEKSLRGAPVPALAAAVAKAQAACTSKTASILADVLTTAQPADLDAFKDSLLDRETKLAFMDNPDAYGPLTLLSKADPPSLEKRAAAKFSTITPSVFQVVKQSSGYSIKTASHQLWFPISWQDVDRGELVRRCGEKVALAVDLSGSATMGDGVVPSEEGSIEQPEAGPELISTPGIYSVQAANGQMLTGSVITNLVDVDGKPLPISLFTDGKHAVVQADISGIRAGDFAAPGSVPSSAARGHGVFFSEEGGLPVATIPLSLSATVQTTGEDSLPHFQAETFDGRPVQVSVQPYVQSVQPADGTMLIPASWAWIPLDGATETSLAETPEEVKTASSIARSISSVAVRAGGPDSFSLSGWPVEKLSADARSFLTQDDALFLLVGLGADPTYAQKKLASAVLGNRPVSVKVARHLKLAEEVRGEDYVEAANYLEASPRFRHRLWKEAAAIPDPVAVDSVLSLGFINPENIATYIGYLPVLDEAQRRMCELLIGSRLGIRELPDGALERAIRALEDVIEGLKVVAFQG